MTTESARTKSEIDKARSIVAKRIALDARNSQQKTLLQGVLIALVWASGDDSNQPFNTMQRILDGEEFH